MFFNVSSGQATGTSRSKRSWDQCWDVEVSERQLFSQGSVLSERKEGRKMGRLACQYLS